VTTRLELILASVVLIAAHAFARYVSVRSSPLRAKPRREELPQHSTSEKRM
jgi:hypothetical protein